VDATAASGSDTGAGIFFLVMIVIGACLYFLPSIVAKKRNVPDLGTVVVLNTFLGWTFIGWVVSLSMAFRSRTVPFVIQPQTVVFPPQPTVQAGWYPDPQDAAVERYWNGTEWTSSTRAPQRRIS
jgi:hypothetical protein